MRERKRTMRKVKRMRSCIPFAGRSKFMFAESKIKCGHEKEIRRSRRQPFILHFDAHFPQVFLRSRASSKHFISFYEHQIASAIIQLDIAAIVVSYSIVTCFAIVFVCCFFQWLRARELMYVRHRRLIPKIATKQCTNNIRKKAVKTISENVCVGRRVNFTFPHCATREHSFDAAMKTVQNDQNESTKPVWNHAKFFSTIFLFRILFTRQNIHLTANEILFRRPIFHSPAFVWPTS